MGLTAIVFLEESAGLTNRLAKETGASAEDTAGVDEQQGKCVCRRDRIGEPAETRADAASKKC